MGADSVTPKKIQSFEKKQERTKINDVILIATSFLLPLTSRE